MESIDHKGGIEMKVRFVTSLDKFKGKRYPDEVPDYLSKGDLIRINGVQLEISTKYYDIDTELTILELWIPQKYFRSIETGGGIMAPYEKIYF